MLGAEERRRHYPSKASVFNNKKGGWNTLMMYAYASARVINLSEVPTA